MPRPRIGRTRRLGAPEQVPRHGVDLRGAGQRGRDRLAAGGGALLRVADLERHPARPEPLDAQLLLELPRELLEVIDQGIAVERLARERRLAGEALGVARGAHRRIVGAGRAGVDAQAVGPEQRLQPLAPERRHLADRVRAVLGQRARRLLPDALETGHRDRAQEGRLLRRRDPAHALPAPPPPPAGPATWCARCPTRSGRPSSSLTRVDPGLRDRLGAVREPAGVGVDRAQAGRLRAVSTSRRRQAIRRRETSR